MIGYLSGQVIDTREHSVVLDIGGVGYEVFVPAHIIGKNPLSLQLWTITVVRENSIELFGFDNKIEHDLFKKLINVSGVGPRTGLNILNIAPAQHIITAVRNNDASLLTKVSGVGKKTAEKVVLELRDKLEDFIIDDTSTTNDHNDLIDALVGLGYSQLQARDALANIKSDVTDFNQRVREALRFLS